MRRNGHIAGDHDERYTVGTECDQRSPGSPRCERVHVRCQGDGVINRFDVDAMHGTHPRQWTEADFPFEILAIAPNCNEVVTDMSKSRRLGFLDYQPSDEAFFDLFARLRADRVIP